MRHSFLLSAIFTLVFATSACEGDITLGDIGGVTQTYDREEPGNASWELGEIPEDCEGEDPAAGVQYVHREADGIQYCLIIIEWDRLMIDMAEIKEEVQTAVEEKAPVDGEAVDVKFTEFAVKDVAIELVKEGEDGDEVTLPFDSVVYYLATLQVEELSDLVGIDWPVPGEALDPDSPRVTFSSDGDQTAKQELLDYLNQAYTDGDEVKTIGHAELEFAYTTQEEIEQLSGSSLDIDFTLVLSGEGTYDIGQTFGVGGDEE